MGNFKKLLVSGASLCMLYTAPSIAQDENDDDSLETQSLEEIVVTGRKREESLQDIPVSISVLGSSLLAEQNILDQGDLAELVPGLNYNQGNDAINDRIAALPSIRGISSNEIATNRTKVSSFVDGMPILGSVGAINIGGAAQVEVYSGPQSAAFGRSTFAGAINYVTLDPADELEGTVGLNWSNEGTRIVSGSLGGPITDTLGFQLGAQYEDSVSPDADLYSYSDGVEADTRGGTNLSARFVFEPTDAFKAKLTFTHDETDDGPNSSFYATQESAAACYNSLSNTFPLYTGMGPDTVGIDGEFDCELDVEKSAGLLGVNDIARYYQQNTEAFDALVADLRAAGATDGEYTVEEAAQIIAAAYSVPFEDVGSQSERDRVSGQFDYLLDNGSAIQLSVMKSKEDYIRQSTPINDDEPQTIAWDDVAGLYTYGADYMGRLYAEADPTTIEENYIELRWASPAEERIRYVVGASYYDYEFVTTIYRDGGYAALQNGTADALESLTGQVVSASTILSEVTENSALFFNASYDFTDTITGSLEGRYSKDKVGGIIPGVTSEYQTSNSFVPRLGINWTPSENTTYYFQYAIGINPGGINADLLDPDTVALLDEGVPVDLDPTDADPTTTNIVSVDYDSSDYVGFDEEKLTNYEFGFKGSALDGRLSYTGAIYHMIWEDAVQSINLNWDYTYADDDLAGTLVAGETDLYYVSETSGTEARVSANSGTSETTGIELQANYLLTDNWSISGNTSIMNAKYTDYCSEDDYTGVANDLGAYAGLDVSTTDLGNTCYVFDGKKLANQPSFTLSLTPSYRTELDNGMRFSSSARINHTGAQYADSANVQKVPANTTVNLTFGLSKDAWSGSFYIENLFDDRSITDANFTDAATYLGRYPDADLDPTLYFNDNGTDYASMSYRINEGRSYGLRLNYNF